MLDFRRLSQANGARSSGQHLPEWATSSDFGQFEQGADVVAQPAVRRREISADRARGPRGTDPYLIAAQSSSAQPTKTKEPGPNEKLKLFQTYMKDNYGLSEADAGKMLGAYGVWQANPANWRKGTILGLTANVNGQMSPSQDRMLRSVMGSACDQDLRERVLRGYEEAQKNGKVRIVDDPTKPQPVR